MASQEVDYSFNSITKSIENSNEDFETDKKTNGNNANGNNITSTNISGNWNNKIRKENQSCDSSFASIQEQKKGKQLSKKLSNNRSSSTAWKDDTSEQTKKIIILDDSIVKHVRGS